MSEKHLKRTPHNVTNDFWWYEENRGISVLIRFTHSNGERKVKSGHIPWRAIRNALARKDKK